MIKYFNINFFILDLITRICRILIKCNIYSLSFNNYSIITLPLTHSLINYLRNSVIDLHHTTVYSTFPAHFQNNTHANTITNIPIIVLMSLRIAGRARRTVLFSNYIHTDSSLHTRYLYIRICLC